MCGGEGNGEEWGPTSLTSTIHLLEYFVALFQLLSLGAHLNFHIN